MTYSEWDNTVWSGALVSKPALPALPAAKAVYGAGVVSMMSDPALSILGQRPQDKFARYLGLYRYGWFNKAGSKIARDIASLDQSLQRGEATLPEPDAVLMRAPWQSLSAEQQVQRLIARPNPKQTRRQFTEKLQIRADFAGNGLVYYDTPDALTGIPQALWGISPARMFPAFDKSGNLIGWVMDADGRGGGVPFTPAEIGHLAYATPDDDLWGVGVVEAIAAQATVSDLLTRHTIDLLSTGGRLAGMISPKNRALEESEFQDVVKTWRNVSSDPNAARRLLVFPEPMEWSAGAADPKDLGLPELAALTREEILSAFPMDYALLGGPLAAGLANGGSSRREIKKNYWEGTQHPRVEALEEFWQEGLIARLEAATGQEYDFEIAEPNLDDAESLLDKVGAFRALVSAGFDEDESVAIVGLDHIKFNGLPTPPPEPQVSLNETQTGGTRYGIAETLAGGPSATGGTPAKAYKAQREHVIDPAADGAKHNLSTFFEEQRRRIIVNVTNLWPASKAARKTIGDDWWVTAEEDAQLSVALSYLYREVARGGLQVVADRLGRVLTKNQWRPVADDIIRSGGTRIAEINETTRVAITDVLSEGARRGYSIAQIVDGVAGDAFTGLKDLSLGNGAGAWSELRAETIARTETATAYNQAALGGYKSLGVDRVHVYDGDGDEICAPWDGWEGPLSEAPEATGHPNCTRDFAPLVGDIAKSVTAEDRFYDFGTAGKALEVRSQPVSIVVPEISLPDSLAIPARAPFPRS